MLNLTVFSSFGEGGGRDIKNIRERGGGNAKTAPSSESMTTRCFRGPVLAFTPLHSPESNQPTGELGSLITLDTIVVAPLPPLTLVLRR